MKRRAGRPDGSAENSVKVRDAKVFLDLVTVRFLLSYATRPIHIFGVLGLFSGFGGLLVLAYLTYAKLVWHQTLSDRPLLMLGVLLVMVGVQLLTMGLVGELVVRTYHESSGQAIYAIRELLAATDPPADKPDDEDS